MMTLWNANFSALLALCEGNSLVTHYDVIAMMPKSTLPGMKIYATDSPQKKVIRIFVGFYW